MAGVDKTLVAATAMLQSLARDKPTRGSVFPLFDFEFIATNGPKSSNLPREPSPAKLAFEAELEGLMRRVHHLEFQVVSHHKLPDNPQQTTPYAIGSKEKEPDFLWTFGLDRLLSGKGSDSSCCLTQQQKLNQPDRRQRTPSDPEEKFPHPSQPSAPVGDLNEDDKEDETGARRVVCEEDISIRYNHVQKQAEEISFHKDVIAQVRDEFQKQEEHHPPCAHQGRKRGCRSARTGASEVLVSDIAHDLCSIGIQELS